MQHPSARLPEDDTWTSRWQKSSWKAKDGQAGEFTLSAGKWYGDAEADKGIKTGPDSKFFAISSELKKPFTNDKKDLVVQFSVKHEQDIDCGGGYIKLVPGSSKDKIKDFGGDTPYSVMFGPDICGFGTRKVHVILPYKGKNHLIKKDITAKTDTLTHVYTLRIMPNNTYQVLIDLEQVAEGSLEDDWDMLPPKKIKDSKASKPSDWDERPKIADPEDKKPEGYDDIPATLPDPDAKKPEDWDDEDDGEWEAPTIPNPEYKGEWKPKQIDNPAYKGIWEAPDIDNPEYKADPNLHLIKDTKYVGFELWQVKSGSIFDNIIVTDDLAEAKKLAEETWGKSKDAEKAMQEKIKKEEDEKSKASETKEDSSSKDSEEDEYDDGEEDDKKDGKAPEEKLDAGDKEEDEQEDDKEEL
ncbi:Calreticulin Flags: Precursor [Monoraphidium neglectum]|uniref:Calreticulin n=1 Tax=Monoraphidium neglectum TaxID=145388 RepID=A0A0D2MRU5_9CHLO|nr:Calreticulin Flags: Precursor [Monoraphidium neglectum]KIZ03137.1 Calreticulin Flags: Precursor [Monoraphidium neglectum]|eukprot:XP_013902156.1 Calreticulin Flags: Precursor [Monoraphidium neglectum]